MKKLKRSSIEVWRYFEETKRTMGFEIWMATDGSTSGLWFRMGTLVSKRISRPYLNYCQFYYNQSTYKGQFSNYFSQSKWWQVGTILKLSKASFSIEFDLDFKPCFLFWIFNPFLLIHADFSYWDHQFIHLCSIEGL